MFGDRYRLAGGGRQIYDLPRNIWMKLHKTSLSFQMGWNTKVLGVDSIRATLTNSDNWRTSDRLFEGAKVVARFVESERQNGGPRLGF